jgi:hypothetical protein
MKARGSGTASLPFLAGGDNHHYLQKEETQQAVDFNFLLSFPVSGLSFSALVCCSFLLSVADLVVGEGAAVVVKAWLVFTPVGSSGGWACCCRP